MTLGLLIVATTGLSQKTKVSGKVVDEVTGEALPFVNISFQDSKIGTITDINGNYNLETYYVTDSLVASFVGYRKMAKAVQHDVAQTIDFSLSSGSIALTQVNIVADKKLENPAHPIIRSVLKHKKINDKKKLDSYKYEVYNKLEFDLNNMDDDFMNRKVFKPFSFVFDHIDSSSEKKAFLPLFITETLSDFYFQKLPKSQKEIIKATKVSGVQNESVSQFLGDMYQNLNVYDNYIAAFGKSFTSPISDLGFFSYKYYLLDSAFIDNYWCYKIKFQPKRKYELTFEGEMWIHDTTYALKSIEASISGDANINFIKELSVKQEFEQVEHEVWMMVKDQLIIDFTVSNKAMGFYGRKSSTYRGFEINKPKPEEFFTGGEDIIVMDGAEEKDKEFWDESRHEKLSEKEKNIYEMVETIKKLPAFKTYVDIITIFVSGYKVIGDFELGPYFTMYSFNPIEGHRFRFGGRTSNAFSKRLMLESYVAYGTNPDQEQPFKYGGGFKYFLSKKPRLSVGASYKNDVEQLGQGQNAWRQDNILASVFRSNPAVKLNGFEEITANINREWFQGFSTALSLSNRRIWSLGENLRFESPAPDGTLMPVSNIISSEVQAFARFAYKEKYVNGQFERVSLGTKYPVLQVKYTLGLKGVMNSGYEYHKLQVNVSDKIRINPIGFSDILFEAGKVYGELPFPLLELHNGNETFSYDVTAFNLMDFYEFVSDEYMSLSVVHHFNGLLLNKIPLMRRLKWREVATAKGVMGRLTGNSESIMAFPDKLGTLGKPYYEAGVGVENIFQVFRFDYLWRLTHLRPDDPDFRGSNFRVTVQVVF